MITVGGRESKAPSQWPMNHMDHMCRRDLKTLRKPMAHGLSRLVTVYPGFSRFILVSHGLSRFGLVSHASSRIIMVYQHFSIRMYSTFEDNPSLYSVCQSWANLSGWMHSSKEFPTYPKSTPGATGLLKDYHIEVQMLQRYVQIILE